MKVKIKFLKKTDIGRKVKYTSSGGDKIEFGFITSWNEKYVFVRYFLQIKPNKVERTGGTSEATDPNDLVFSF